MAGPIALVGSGEFTTAMAEVDTALLEATGRRRPRVVLLPTASYPDGEETFQRWASMGQAHFEALGAEVEPVMARIRADAHDAASVQAACEADLIYLSGGRPAHLLEVLEGSPLGDAIRAANERGAVVAGCSAGAMVLCAQQPRLRRRLPLPPRWRRGLGLVEGCGAIPHYDKLPEVLSVVFVLRAPRRLVVLGIDEDTAAIGRDGVFQVHGRARITIWRGRHRERHRAGEAFRLEG